MQLQWCLKMLLELTKKQRVVTYAGITLASLILYFLVRHSPMLQSLYLALVAVLFSGDRPTLIYATVASLPRDLK